MEKTVRAFGGDSDSPMFSVHSFHFSGAVQDAPSVYIQAALHANEHPGTAALNTLLPRLKKADDEARINGRITIVPVANPVGRSQFLFGAMQGRFDLSSRKNFNREFQPPRVDGDFNCGSRILSVDQRLKQVLLELAQGHDIVLDLHCDDEAIPYMYVHSRFWPNASDSAVALGMEAVVTWEGASGGAFEEVVGLPAIGDTSNPERGVSRQLVATIEYRGLCDVSLGTAERDADGIYELLLTRGVIVDESYFQAHSYEGPVFRQENIEVIASPKAGIVMYDVGPGAHIKRGSRLAVVITEPGEEYGVVEIYAPQDGLVVTRRGNRFARAGDQLFKIGCAQLSVNTRSGPFED